MSTENRLAVYMALGGKILNAGVNENVAHDQYKNKYTQLDAIEKKNCDKNSIKGITAMILFGNVDNEHFRNLQKKVHNDHLKNQEKGISLYQRTITGVLRLLANHSEVKEGTTKEQKPKDTEIAFAQGSGNGGRWTTRFQESKRKLLKLRKGGASCVGMS